MPKRKTKNTASDKMLALLFVIAIVFNFWFVSLVSASFENAESEILFKSDSGTEFGHYAFYKDGAPYTASYTNFTSGINALIGGTVFAQYEKTPVYLGNNSWSIPVNETVPQYSTANYVIEMPNLDEWLIQNITFEFEKGESQDMELYTRFVFMEKAGRFDVSTDKSITVSHIPTDFGDADVYYNTTIDLDTYETVDIYDSAQDKICVLYVFARCTDLDGFDEDFNFNINVEISGVKQAEYNIIQQMQMVMGLTLFVNIMVVVFMNDRFDIGGFVNDIPNKKRR